MSANRSIAVLVHLFTLSGVVLALLAMDAVVRGDLPSAFAWLGLALIVDGADGPLARHFRIREYLPRWQGEVFDLIIDYVTYVFIPAFMLLWGSVVPDGWELPAAGLICVTSAFHFADLKHKTKDWYFFGFPAIWNVVVFYLVVFALPPIASMVLIVFFAVMTFVPAAYIHPMRVTRMRRVTMIVSIAWMICALAAVVQGLNPETWIKIGLVVTMAYFAGISLWRSVNLTAV